MEDKEFLMIPGPTPTPQSALLSLAQHPIGHRTSEFSEILHETEDLLQWIFQTKQPVFIYTASGTGAMEAAISNVINPGETVLSLVCGKFGERWGQLVQVKGGLVEILEAPWGTAIAPEKLEQRLLQDTEKKIKAVTLTHNETSTGITNDLQKLSEIIHRHGALIIVDAITSLGAIDLQFDNWHIDIAVSGSQKGFMIPPGLAFLAVSEKALQAREACSHVSLYFDFKQYLKSMHKDTTPYTPAVSLVVALNTTLKMMKREGLEAIFGRHQQLKTMLRLAVKALGLELFVKEDGMASNAITSIVPLHDVTVPDIRKKMKQDFDILIANAQDPWKDKFFRIGHLGFCSYRDLLATVSSLECVLKELNYPCTLGAGSAAAQQSLLEYKQHPLPC